MAIAANDLVDKFGTQDQVDDGTTSAIASAAMSVAADAATWTNDDDAPEAVFALKARWSTVTNVANKVLNLYAQPLNVQSTNNPPDPSTSRKATLIGKFTVYAASSGVDYWFNTDDICPLPNFQTSQQFKFFLENLTGQQVDAGWALYITPKTVGPKA